MFVIMCLHNPLSHLYMTVHTYYKWCGQSWRQTPGKEA